MSLLHPPRRPGRAIGLVLLFVAAIVLRVFRATQETIANPDIMRYIDQARGLAAAPVETLRNEVYHPLHAMAALGVHTLIQPLFDNDRLAWLWSMRSVGIVAAAVVTVEVVLLARLLGAPFWAAMLAGTAWLVGRRTSVYGSDGLSDMLAIALFGGAMILGFHALRGVPRVGWGRGAQDEIAPQGGRKWLLWFGEGLAAGLSYLTR